MTQQVQQPRDEVPAAHRRRERDDRRPVRQPGPLTGAMEELNRRAVQTYQLGDEQFTAFTWAVGSPPDWAGTVETGNIRRYARDLAVMAVGFSGQNNNHIAGELVTVIAPVRTAEALTNPEVPHNGTPISRTFHAQTTHGRPPFDLHLEARWARSASFLASQLMSLINVSRGEKLESNHHVFGRPAVRSPRPVVDMTHGQPAENGIPPRPVFVDLDELPVDQSVPIGTDQVLYDIESLGHAQDVTGWTKEDRRLVPLYGQCPWFVLPGNIRSVWADLGIMRAYWWL